MIDQYTALSKRIAALELALALDEIDLPLPELLKIWATDPPVELVERIIGALEVQR